MVYYNDGLKQAWTTQIFKAKSQGLTLICFYSFNGFSDKQTNLLVNIWVLGAKLIASEGNTWPAGRMLCMPELKHN